VSEPTKVCTRCKKERYLWQFYKCRKHKDGLQYICRQCHVDQAPAYSKAAKERAIRTGAMTKWFSKNYG
jgi:hypothetical protein